MNFQLSEDQLALRDGLQAIVDGYFSLDQVRERETLPSVVDPVGWQALSDAGVFSLLVPEVAGGLGLSMTDAVVAVEVLGHALVPGPIVGTMLAAGTVDGALDGTTRVGIANVASTSAIPSVIELPEDCDEYIVLPSARDGATPATSVRRADVAVTPATRSLDPLHPVGRLTKPLAISTNELPATADSVRRAALLLTAAFEVGLAAFALERSVTYAKDRYQFGRPIGSFQAIKHLLADELAKLEMARAQLHYAAVVTDAPDVAVIDGEVYGLSATQLAWRAIAGAKLLCDSSAISATKTAVQVHGGMGYTWEVPVHLALKRARVHATMLATSDQMADIVASLTQ
jgi:alkylation response protein AidB-like acyl-CoA dehydrogenase